MATRACLLVALSGLLATAAGCGVNIDTQRPGFPCDPGGGCASGLVCVDGTCEKPGTLDGGSTDGGSTDAGTSPGGVPNPTTSATIGYPGGSLHLAGATVTFPEGALGTPTLITLTRLSTVAPAGDGPMSPMYALDPAGLRLARPATVTLAFQGSASDASGYWQATTSGGMERIGADQVDGAGAHFGIVRLGEGFVGSIAAHPTFTLYGVASTAWIGQDGPTVEPTSLAGATISAVLADGTTLPGSPDAQGIFRIPGVTEGTHAVLVQQSANLPAFGVVTSRHVLDESRVIIGRPWDATPVASPNTTFTTTVTGLRPMTTSSTVNGISPDLRIGLNTLTVNANGTTATEPSAQAVGGPLPGGGGHADVLWVWQTANGFTSSFGTASASVAMGQTPFTLTDGASNPVTVPMRATQANRTFSADVHLGAVPPSFGQVPGSPAAPQTDMVLRIFPAPVGMADVHLQTQQQTGTLANYVGGRAELVYAIAQNGAGGTAKLAVPYVDILPATWSRFWYLESSVTTQLGGGVLGGATATVYSQTQGEGDVPTTTVEPAISAPTGIRINGLPGSSTGLSGVGTTPTVSWTAPSSGIAGGYLLVVWHFATFGDTPVLALLVDGSPVTIPPGHLQSGSYRITVTAVAPDLPGHAAPLTGAPWRALPWSAGITQATTQYFSP